MQDKIYGNEVARERLHLMMGDYSQFPFIIVYGPSHIGKMTTVVREAQERVGGYTQDVLVVRNCSSSLGKKHTIKVDNDNMITCEDKTYHDIGSRQMIQRLTRSPSGGNKFIVIEDIDRMTPSAANALLKSLEEPLEHRKIIATTDNKNAILPTIISRATLLAFSPLTSGEMNHYMKDHNIGYVDNVQYFAGGKPGLIDTLMQDTDKRETMSSLFEKLQQYRNKPSLNVLYKHLQYIEKLQYTDMICTALIQWLGERDMYEDVDMITRIYETRQSNIAMDTILFSIALERVRMSQD